MTIRRGDSIIAGNAGGIPSQTGQSGKFLTTNGTTTSWAAVNVDTSDIYNKIDAKQDILVSGTSIKTINNEPILGSGDITISGNPEVDGVTVDLNNNRQLRTIAVTDNKDNAIKTWTGTLAEYNAIETPDPTTLYNITDDAETPDPLIVSVTEMPTTVKEGTYYFILESDNN